MPSTERVRRGLGVAFLVGSWGSVGAIAVIAFVRLVEADRWAPLIALAAVAPGVFLLGYLAFVVGLVQRRRALVVSAACAIVAQLIWFGSMLPLVHRDRSLPAGAVTLRIATANVLYDNRRAADVARTITTGNPDLIAIEEYSTVSGPPIEKAAAFAAYPYRELRPRPSPDGIALYSRFPIRDAQLLFLASRQVLRATVETAVGDVTVVVVHTVAPLDSGGVGIWSAELRQLGSLLRGVSGPLIVVGDFNATQGNRQFVDLQHQGKVRDVLNATGDGYAMTWPANWTLTPPLVRPDHVLVGRGIVPLGGHTVDLPGSDHRGIVVDVGVSRPG